MDITKLKQIKEMGFSALITNENRASFKKVTSGYRIEINYDHTKNIFSHNVIYLNTSTNATYSTSGIQEYINDLQKAKIIMSKLEEE